MVLCLLAALRFTLTRLVMDVIYMHIYITILICYIYDN